MPFMNGNEACKNIQEYYNCIRKKSLIEEEI